MFSEIINFIKHPRSSHKSEVALIVLGIGNKGPHYRDTRHNIGFSIVDSLKGMLREIKKERIRHSDAVVGKLINDKFVSLVKPQVYVNRSGLALKACINYYDCLLSSCLVIVDDFNLPLGRIRIRPRGSDGGHRGLRSIISEVGENFPRLRVGIGPLPENIKAVDFVLGKFNANEENLKNRTIDNALSAILFICENGIETAMNKFNK